MTTQPIASLFRPDRSAARPHSAQRHRRLGTGVAAVLSLGLLSLSQAALATKVWNASPNKIQNNWISGMYDNITGPLQTTLRQCQNAPQATCEVTIQANGGVHTSASDDTQHFTLRFTGNAAPYAACHIYPLVPGTPGDKRLQGATCYDAQHNGTYIKLN
ncbi:hypothetical protein [Xanthomonas sp. 3058]|uniref:hypothetical protein n=1 Tax=Xanthomonas sp. 3058 TaxID=3035314 RepID=UPI001613A55A|nr:hypothetical protein [Xanthomonas sp. 3058]MBB5864919.1 hypothetical protein [Xanthomonas sp. 3058]